MTTVPNKPSNKSVTSKSGNTGKRSKAPSRRLPNQGKVSKNPNNADRRRVRTAIPITVEGEERRRSHRRSVMRQNRKRPGTGTTRSKLGIGESKPRRSVHAPRQGRKGKRTK